MIYRKNISVLIIFIVLFTFKTYAQQEKYYAAFVYQFTNFISWPNVSSPFIIGVIGNSSVTQYFRALAREKKIGLSNIEIKEWNTLNDIGQCDILFIPESQKSDFTSIVTKLSSKPVLIITESQGYAKQGAGISFQKTEGKIQFELNKTSINKAGLEVNSGLERLAAKVY